MYQVTWDQSRENGAHIELYSLEGKIETGKRQKREVNFTLSNNRFENNNMVLDDTDDMGNDNEWVVYYNGTGKFITLMKK